MHALPNLKEDISSRMRLTLCFLELGIDLIDVKDDDLGKKKKKTMNRR
jgi:hypothetical protein